MTFLFLQLSFLGKDWLLNIKDCLPRWDHYLHLMCLWRKDQGTSPFPLWVEHAVIWRTMTNLCRAATVPLVWPSCQVWLCLCFRNKWFWQLAAPVLLAWKSLSERVCCRMDALKLKAAWFEKVCSAAGGMHLVKLLKIHLFSLSLCNAKLRYLKWRLGEKDAFHTSFTSGTYFC